MNAAADSREATTLQALERFWRGERTGPLVTVVQVPGYRQVFDHHRPNPEAVAEAAAGCVRADRAAADPHVLPAIYCDFGTISTAKLYGGRVIPPPEGGMVHIESRIREASELAGLTPCPFEDSDFQIAVDVYHRIHEQLGDADVFLRTPDFQGPLNTLALVMDQEELLVAMYTEPDAVHAALDAVTDTLIDYHARLRRELGGGRVVGNIWPYTFLPESLGASITQDMMPLLSADLYREFELPRLGRIAKAFGGVQIHCCGRYGHHLSALRDSGILIRGLEFHHPFTPFSEIHAVFGDDIVYIPYLFGECHDYPDYVAFAADLLRQGSAKTRFWFAMAEGWCDADALRALIA